MFVFLFVVCNIIIMEDFGVFCFLGYLVVIYDNIICIYFFRQFQYRMFDIDFIKFDFFFKVNGMCDNYVKVMYMYI